MMWYYGSWGWVWMIPMMLVFWGAVVAVVVFSVRSLRPGPGPDAAIETLRRRFAAGEITQEEFEKSRQVLQG